MCVKYLANEFTKILQGGRFFNKTSGEHCIANVLIISDANALQMQSSKYYWAVVLGRFRFFKSVSVFGFLVGFFSSRFGFRFRFFKNLGFGSVFG